MTQEERESAANGIWLCRNCGTLVDDDKGGFPADLLRKWKTDAIADARERVVVPKSRLHIREASANDDRALIEDRERFRLLMKEYPSNSGPIAFLNGFAAETPFERARLMDLSRLFDHWTAPENTFADPRVAAALRTLAKCASSLLAFAAIHTFVRDGDQRLSEVPPEWEYKQPQRYKDVVKTINGQADAVVAAHQAFVDVARAALRI